jgi:hypothetical protein
VQQTVRRVSGEEATEGRVRARADGVEGRRQWTVCVVDAAQRAEWAQGAGGRYETERIYRVDIVVRSRCVVAC